MHVNVSVGFNSLLCMCYWEQRISQRVKEAANISLLILSAGNVLDSNQDCTAHEINPSLGILYQLVNNSKFYHLVAFVLFINENLSSFGVVFSVSHL